MKKHFLLIPVLLISIHAPAQFQKTKRTDTTRPATKPVMVNNQPAVIKNTISDNTSYDFSTVRICVDQPQAGNNLPPRNTGNTKPIPTINADGSLSSTGVIRQGLVY